MDRQKPMRLSIGAPTVITLFAVLCLTVLASLSLLSANAQLSLAERSAAAARAYYDADTRAAEIFERILQGDARAYFDADTYSNADGSHAYTVTVSARQSLEVRYSVTRDGSVTLESWKLIETGAWGADGGMNLLMFD